MGSASPTSGAGSREPGADVAEARDPAQEFSTTWLLSDRESREIRSLRGGPTLILHIPTGKPKATIVMISGWGGTRTGPGDILVDLATRLVRENFLVARFDVPGRGDAQGDLHSVDLDAMIASAALAAEGTNLADEKPPLYFLGMCSGGNVALGASTLRGSRVAGIVSISILPFQPARAATFDRARRWKNIKHYAKKALSPSTWLRLVKGEINVGRVKQNVTATEKVAAGQRNLKDSARDIEKELLSWKGRALFLWGGGDEEAPPARAHFERLHEKGMGKTGETFFKTVDGANHNFYGRAWREQLAAEIIAFLK